MDKIKVSCPSCLKEYTVYVDSTLCFYCTPCELKIKFDLQGNSKVYQAPLNLPKVDSSLAAQQDPLASSVKGNVSNTTLNNPQPSKAKHDIGMVINYALIIGFIVAAIIYVFSLVNTKATNNHPATIYQSQSSSTQPISDNPNPTENGSSVNSASASAPEGKLAICYIHIVNSLVGSDKSEKCSAILDENNHCLILESIDYKGESFKFNYRDGGVIDFQFLILDNVQSENVLYRRSDLETGNGTLIYTNKTNEITISLSYQ